LDFRRLSEYQVTTMKRCGYECRPDVKRHILVDLESMTGSPERVLQNQKRLALIAYTLAGVVRRRL